SRDLRACFLAALLEMPVVWEAHHPVSLSNPCLSALFSADSFVAVVAISDRLRRHFERFHPELRGRVVVARSCAAIRQGVSRNSVGAQQKLNVGYVGHLYRGKGMEIVAELARLCEWAHFHVVGGRPEDVQRWKKRCSSLSNVSFY